MVLNIGVVVGVVLDIGVVLVSIAGRCEFILLLLL